MNATPIDKLERQLQGLIEGAFTRLFPRSTGAPDIAVLLFRSMEAELRHSGTRGGQPIAPDVYEVFLHSKSVKQLMTHMPDFPARLAALIAELSRESGYRLKAAPEVAILADSNLAPHQARVSAAHSATWAAETVELAAVSADEIQRPGIRDRTTRTLRQV